MATRNIDKPVQYKTQYIYMLQDVTGYCLDPLNRPTTKLIPDFETGMLTVDDHVKTIVSILGPRLTMVEGWGDQKKYYRDLLCEAMFAVSSPVAGWAIANNQRDLAKQLSRTITDYQKMKPNNLESQATNIVTIVTPLLPSIIKTGVTQAALDAIISARASFIPYANKPANSKKGSKAESEMVTKLLTEAINITYFQLDRYSIRFKQMGKFAFFFNYKSRRKLSNYGARHANAIVDVFAGDALPLDNAMVTLNGTKLKAVTKGGHCVLSPVPPGMYSITVTSSLFPNPVTTEPQEFVKGKPTYFTVNMTEFNLPAAPQQKDKVSK